MRRRLRVLTGGTVAVGVLLLASAAWCASSGDPAGNPRAGGEPAELQRRVAASFAQTGQQHLNTGRIRDAIKDFSAALNFDPQNAQARDGLALARRRLAAAGDAPAKPAAKPAAPAPAPRRDDANLVRARASLKVLCEAARDSLAKGDHRAAADAYQQVLDAARPLARQADVSGVVAEATVGLTNARKALARTARPAEPTPGPGVPAPRVRKEPVRRAGLDDDMETAMDKAMRDISSMMRPQTDILSRPEPGRGTVLPRGRRQRDDAVDVIGRAGFKGDDDEDAEKLIKAKLLTKMVSVDFKDEPFSRAIDYLRAATGVNVLVDPAVEPNTVPVNFTVVNMELGHLFDWMLRFQKLDYRIRDGAIFISNSAGLADRPMMVSHEISDLTVTLKDFRVRDGGNMFRRPDWEGVGRDMGIDGPKRSAIEAECDRRGEEWARFVRENVSPSTWASEGGVAQNTIAYRNGKLVVTHTPEVQEQIRELLASFRKARAIQVAILARFVEISENKLHRLGVEWTGLGEDGNIGFQKTGTSNSIFAGELLHDPGVGTGTAFADVTGMTLNVGWLGAWQVNAIVTAVEKHNQGNILTAPRVTCFNTQRAFLTIATIQNYVRSYDSDGNPEIGQVNDGIILEVQPFVSADRRYVTLELIPQINTVGDFTEFTYRADPVDDTVDDDVATLQTTDRIQLPEVTTRQIMTTVSVPDGGTLMIGGLARARAGEGEGKTPLLGDLPLLGVFFRSRTKVDSRENLIILVTAHIIQQGEE